ncbi:MAG: mechanosensitive ion channel family protein [Deltaproteobacteria bacterium]|nr:mechanosensitive ion channel family protein [Deltaproteobacteria bacterium]
MWLGIGSEIIKYLYPPHLANLLRVGAILLAGLLILFVLRRSLKWVYPYLTRHQSMLLNRAITYTIVLITLAMVLNQLGISLAVLLGTAGILTLALSLAAQTSLAHFISGIFLIGERAFSVGDVIEVEGVTGEVLSIDLLSVKLKTGGNLFVRIPNETLLKSKIANLTHFRIRAIEIKLRFSFSENIEKISNLISEIIQNNSLCLPEPKPTIILSDLKNGILEIDLLVSTKKENFLQAKNQLIESFQKAFLTHQIKVAENPIFSSFRG